ncbi:MAG: response regulator [Spirochaetaceae bacterium]|jgi:response regulator RpfG family c-di-GMP phosphodiesterase|nr:response regulator [Spirochaetaceae bacterium]
MESKKTILIIDDSPMNLRSMKLMLEDAFNVLPATSGSAGMLVINSAETIDLILLDIDMPAMSGFDFMSLLPTLLPEKARIPVICVTGIDATADFVAKTVSAGAVDYISKPVNKAVLEQKIAKVLDIPAKKTVLIIDDAPETLRQMRMLLKARYNPVPANSGEAALRMLRSEPFDLILLDIDMPNMSGFDFMRRLRSIPECSAIPVICVTGMEATVDFVSQTISAGMADYISKPVTQDVLEAKIDKIVQESPTI